MAGSIGVVTGIVIVESGAVLMARVVGNLGKPITQADILSLSYNVRDLTAGTNLAGTFTISQAIFDSLQQGDPRWDKDSIINPGKDGLWGYNFLGTIPPSQLTGFDTDPVTFEVKAHRYQVDVQMVPVVGVQWRIPYAFTPIPTWP